MKRVFLLRQRCFQPRQGFTLVEMLVAAAVLLVVIAGVTQLAIATSVTSMEAVMTTEAVRYSQALVEEQLALGYANLATGHTSEFSYTPMSGKQIGATVEILDTSMAPTQGGIGIGAPSKMIRVTVRWTHPTKGVQVNAQQVYLSRPFDA